MQKLTLVLFTLLFAFSTAAVAEVSIAITNPAPNAHFAANDTVMVTFDIQTTEGEKIKSIHIYNHGKTKTRLSREPWEYEWKTMVAGSYKLEAMITLDDDERTQIWTSEPVYFRCGGVEKGDRVFNGGFENGKLSHWTTNLHEGAQASFNVYDDFYFDDAHYLFVEITNESTENWHIQLAQNVPVDSGHVYDIYFYADADDKRPILVTMQENQDPWQVQMSTDFEISGADEYMTSFEATRTDPSNNIRFNLAANKNAVFLDNIRIVDHNAASVKENRLGSFGAPAEYELFKAYPNPFNMNTTIQYRLSTQADVRLEIYNMTGQLVNTLVNNTQAAGTYNLQWNGTDLQHNVVPSGIYFYRLTYTAEGATSSLHQKVMLVK